MALNNTHHTLTASTHYGDEGITIVRHNLHTTTETKFQQESEQM